MDIKLNVAQYDFVNSTKQNNGLVAGLGAGKSFVATLKCIMKKLEYPELSVAYYLPNYGLIRDIAFDKFPTMLEDMGIKYKLNKSDKEIHIENAGKIIFRSMDAPEMIVGFEVFYSLIDECDILPMQKMEIAYNKILARNRQKADVPNQMDIVGTPEGFKFFYKRYVEMFNEDSDLLIRSTTTSNKHLPPEYIETLRQQYPANLLSAYLEGQFVNLTSGTIYHYFNRERHDTDIVESEDEELLIGQDFNIGGCVSIVYVRRGDTLVAINEYESYDTRAIINNTKDKYPSRVVSFYPDASGNARKSSASDTDIQLLIEAGFKVYVNNKNPAVKDRINITNNLLEKNRLLVNINRCPKYTKALEQHAWSDKGEPEKYTGAGTVDDYTDAGTYPCAYLFPINNYAKISGGFNR